MDACRWIFLRHGQSTANAERWLAGHVDVPLTRLGERQADAARLALVDRHMDRCVSSTLSRAVDTAERVLGGRLIPHTQHPALSERHCGDWAHRSIDDLKSSGDLDGLYTWTGKAPNGENMPEMMDRVLGCLADLDDGTHTTLVVCHGMVIRGVLGLLDGQERATIGRTRIPNAEPILRTVPRGTFAQLRAAL